MLLVLGFVSFFPETATALSDQLAIVGPVRSVLVPAASWLARYEWLGALCLIGGLFLVYKRVTQRHEKKLL